MCFLENLVKEIIEVLESSRWLLEKTSQDSEESERVPDQDQDQSQNLSLDEMMTESWSWTALLGSLGSTKVLRLVSASFILFLAREARGITKDRD